MFVPQFNKLLIICLFTYTPIKENIAQVAVIAYCGWHAWSYLSFVDDISNSIYIPISSQNSLGIEG